MTANTVTIKPLRKTALQTALDALGPLSSPLAVLCSLGPRAAVCAARREVPPAIEVRVTVCPDPAEETLKIWLGAR